MSFSKFKEKRDQEIFNEKYFQLIESISHVSFDYYWENIALPKLLQSNCMEDENQLLNEIGDFTPLQAAATGIGAGMAGLGLLGGKLGAFDGAYDYAKEKGKQAYNYAKDAWNKWRNPQPQTQQPAPQQTQPQADDPRKQHGQENVDISLNYINKLFAKKMQEFMEEMNKLAMRSGNRYFWKTAQLFRDRMLKAAQSSKFIVGQTKDKGLKKQYRNAQIDYTVNDYKKNKLRNTA